MEVKQTELKTENSLSDAADNADITQSQARDVSNDLP